MTLAKCGEYFVEVGDNESWKEDAMAWFAPKIVEEYLDMPELTDVEIKIFAKKGEILISARDYEDGIKKDIFFKVECVEIPSGRIFTIDDLLSEEEE